jgi:plastocyanin
MTSIAPGVQVIHVQGNDALQFAPSSVAVKPGRVRLVFTVVGKTPQTFTSKALKVDSGNVLAGHSATIELVVPGPGKYAFYSAYHKAQGMTGTIIAKR